MPTATVFEQVEIPAPPAVIWEFRADFLNLPLYNPYVSEVERIGPKADSARGARYSFVLAQPGHGSAHRREQRVELEIVESIPASSIVVELAGGMAAREVFKVTQLLKPDGSDSDPATLASIELTMFLPQALDDKSATRLISAGRKQIRMELDNLQVLLSGRQTGPTRS